MKYLVDVIYKSRATFPIEADSPEEARQITKALIDQGISYEPAQDLDPVDDAEWEVNEYTKERGRKIWILADPLFHPKSDIRED